MTVPTWLKFVAAASPIVLLVVAGLVFILRPETAVQPTWIGSLAVLLGMAQAVSQFSGVTLADLVREAPEKPILDPQMKLGGGATVGSSSLTARLTNLGPAHALKIRTRVTFEPPLDGAKELFGDRPIVGETGASLREIPAIPPNGAVDVRTIESVETQAIRSDKDRVVDFSGEYDDIHGRHYKFQLRKTLRELEALELSDMMHRRR